MSTKNRNGRKYNSTEHSGGRRRKKTRLNSQPRTVILSKLLTPDNSDDEKSDYEHLKGRPDSPGVSTVRKSYTNEVSVMDSKACRSPPLKELTDLTTE